LKIPHSNDGLIVKDSEMKIARNEKIIKKYTKNSLVKNNEQENQHNGHQLVAKKNNKKIPHNIQFYIITGHCFKELMMKYSTNARSYYIKLESLASFIYTCIKEYNRYKELQDKEK